MNKYKPICLYLKNVHYKYTKLVFENIFLQYKMRFVAQHGFHIMLLCLYIQAKFLTQECPKENGFFLTFELNVTKKNTCFADVSIKQKDIKGINPKDSVKESQGSDSTLDSASSSSSKSHRR